MHKFVLMVNGKLVTYTSFDDLPKLFDHVIEFAPHIPPEPHTVAQHEEIAGWNKKLQELMLREKLNASSH